MGKDKPEPEQADVYTLNDLEQVKVLADPLRVRILEALCEESTTTKQIADRLGEKPTRLYHHVEALERVGLIRLTRTQQNRGTIEKYYAAVARSFRVEPGLFSGGGGSEETETLSNVVTTMMQNTTEELRKAIGGGLDIGSPEDGIISYVEVRASEEDVFELKDKLMAILKELGSKCCGDEPPEDGRRYRFTLAYFPLDRS